jgi:hypothetical protein
MPTRWAGASGRYQAACEQGHCALTGGAATSKHEGQVFALLSYVIGPGEHDLRVSIGTRFSRLDMAFPLLGARSLGVEYDGAYWHQGQEERDLRKTFMIEGTGQYYVLRIREEPLQPLTPLDVQVPARADPATCAQLALLHLFHELLMERGDDGHRRIWNFLSARAQLLALSDIRCGMCRQVARDCIGSHSPRARRRTG